MYSWVCHFLIRPRRYILSCLSNYAHQIGLYNENQMIQYLWNENAWLATILSNFTIETSCHYFFFLLHVSRMSSKLESRARHCLSRRSAVGFASDPSLRGLGDGGAGECFSCWRLLRTWWCGGRCLIHPCSCHHNTFLVAKKNPSM